MVSWIHKIDRMMGRLVNKVETRIRVSSRLGQPYYIPEYQTFFSTWQELECDSWGAPRGYQTQKEAEEAIDYFLYRVNAIAVNNPRQKDEFITYP